MASSAGRARFVLLICAVSTVFGCSNLPQSGFDEDTDVSTGTPDIIFDNETPLFSITAPTQGEVVEQGTPVTFAVRVDKILEMLRKRLK